LKTVRTTVDGKTEFEMIEEGAVVAACKYTQGNASFIPTISNLKVKLSERKKGYARKLMMKIMEGFGPPIQLQAIPFRDLGEKQDPITVEDLRKFYESLGFEGLPGTKFMLWYLKDNDENIATKQFSLYLWEARLTNIEGIFGTGKTEKESIGDLVSRYPVIFGVKNIGKSEDNDAWATGDLASRYPTIFGVKNIGKSEDKEVAATH